MNITVTVSVPDALVGEGLPVFAEQKGIDLSKMNQKEQINAVAQAIADEQLDRFKELAKERRVQQAITKLEKEISDDK